MIYLSSFSLSKQTVTNPNIYPYHVFAGKDIEPFVFAPVTVFYGNNASGKSTLLNIMANRLKLNGAEFANSDKFGRVLYFPKFVSECSYSLGETEEGFPVYRLPANSRYIKSEDILYEIKKIQQEQALEESCLYEHARLLKSQGKKLKPGEAVAAARAELKSPAGQKRLEIIRYAQEKYSNGETAMQLLEDYLSPDGLYLLDEPEVSLSPQNQVLLAGRINQAARYLNCQFVISTHSPFLLGTLDSKIYNLDNREYMVQPWFELDNVRYFYEFFKAHEKEFGEKTDS